MSISITDIKNKFNTEALSEINCGIKSFRMGWLSELVNANKKEEYPMVLLQPFDSNIANIEETTEVIDLTMYVFDIDHCKDGKDQCRIWEELHHAGIKLLRRVCSDDDYAIVGNVSVSRDSSLHNDKLVGVNYNFQMRISNECALGCCTICDELGNPVCFDVTGDPTYIDCDAPPTNILSYTFNAPDTPSFHNVESFGSDSVINFGDAAGDQIGTDGIELEYEYALSGVYDVAITYPNIGAIVTLGLSQAEPGSIVGVLDLTTLTGLTFLNLLNHELITNVMLPSNSFDRIVFQEGNGDISINITDINTGVNNARYDFINNNFTSTFINKILIDLDSISTTGFTGRILNLQNNSAPTGLGLTAVSNLIAKGFTVTTD